ncbi:DUF3375 domain-containing protein [Acidiferrobacter sp.]|uniref:DUF3375 domain-containing protein n=1 Tax=Acidiferrobacter sp. TaxID=1872107 RepID=UPI002620FAF3|nr:DUF3375 domain-containing protein [Acidiferrobacter sp.]
MSLDYATLSLLRQNHPAWRLLCSDHAPLVASFLERAFLSPNRRAIAEADLIEALEDELYGLREQRGAEAFPRTARAYLDDWASPDKDWLRKFYAPQSDEPQYDLTPAAEKAIAWLATLTARAFVGTGSRLMTLFTLLRQMSEGSETDPAVRLAELRKRRDEIDAEMARIAQGDVPILEDSALKDRFQQFTQLSRDLLSDFRQVEHNFRQLDRRVRERIALWEGSKGALLTEILGERDLITGSDEGQSFQAFFDFLMSSDREEELARRLAQVLALPAIAALTPDPRIRRMHHDWLAAGEHTQRTVARLSWQLRRFLDDRAWLENRRIMDLLRDIEGLALGLREAPPQGPVMTVPETAAGIELPLERPLYSPAMRPLLLDADITAGLSHGDDSALYTQIVVDTAELDRHIRQALQDRAQVTLREICEMHPLRHGLAELVAYLNLATEDSKACIDEGATDVLSWQGVCADGQTQERRAHIPRVIFTR